MPATDHTWVKLNDLLERVTQVEDELLATIEADPSMFRVPGVLHVTAELKRAAESLKVARDAGNARAPAPHHPALLPPSHYVAQAIRSLPRAGPDVPKQVVEIHAAPTVVWPHNGRYRLTFQVRSNSSSEPPGWYWGLEAIECLETEAASAPLPPAVA